MKQLLTIALLTFMSWQTLAQAGKPFALDMENQFEGGKKGYTDFITKNLGYPREAIEAGRQGRVVVGFTLTTENTIEDMVIKNSVGMGCDEEAIRTLTMATGKLKSISKTKEYYEWAIHFDLRKNIDISDQMDKAENLFNQQKFKKALPYFDEVIRSLPYNVDFLLKRGIARNKTGFSSGACADWARANELQSNAADALIAEHCK